MYFYFYIFSFSLRFAEAFTDIQLRFLSLMCLCLLLSFRAKYSTSKFLFVPLSVYRHDDELCPKKEELCIYNNSAGIFEQVAPIMVTDILADCASKKQSGIRRLCLITQLAPRVASLHGSTG